MQLITFPTLLKMSSCPALNCRSHQQPNTFPAACRSSRSRRERPWIFGAFVMKQVSKHYPTGSQPILKWRRKALLTELEFSCQILTSIGNFRLALHAVSSKLMFPRSTVEGLAQHQLTWPILTLPLSCTNCAMSSWKFMMFGKSVGVITTNQFRFDNFALVVKTGSLGALWQRCLIRLHNWEIIFVSAMSPISCGTTLQNKQLKDVERLSPLSFFWNHEQGPGWWDPQIAMRNIQDPLFKSGKPAGAVPPPRESPRAVETATLPAMSTGRKQNPEDCHTLEWIMKILMIWDVFLLHSDHLPQQHILMHCASVTLSDNCGNDEGAKCRWTMLNPSTSQRNFWLLGKTLFKHCTCLGNHFRQRRCFKFHHLQKAKLKGFKGIACRISMFQYMLHLHQVAYCGFGFLYVQLQLLVDDGRELWAKYHGERSKLESLRVGKQKAKTKDVGAEKA